MLEAPVILLGWGQALDCPVYWQNRESNEESALQQLQIQLANPLPYDLEELNLAEYKNLDARWRNWQTVKATCADCATVIFDPIVGLED